LCATDRDVAFLAPHQFLDKPAVFLGRAITQGWQLEQLNLVMALGFQWVGPDCPAPGFELGAPVVPDTVKGRFAGGCLERRDTWPAINPVDEAFFESLAEHISEARDLTRGIGNNE
jgi:hypothetical protein